MDVKVTEIMTHLVVTLHASDSLKESVSRLMRNHIGGAPIVEDGKVIGVLSERDVIRVMWPAPLGGEEPSLLSALLGDGTPLDLDAGCAGDVMSTPPITVGPECTAREAAGMMETNKVTRLPVVDSEGYLLGILCRADLVRALSDARGLVTPS